MKGCRFVGQETQLWMRCWFILAVTFCKSTFSSLYFDYTAYQMEIIIWSGKTPMLGQIEGKSRRRHQRMRWLESIIHSVDLNLSKLWEIVKDREAWHAAVHGVTKIWTQLSDWTTPTFFQVIILSRKPNCDSLKLPIDKNYLLANP